MGARDIKAELANAKLLLQEAWTTLSDVCEFSGNEKYSLDVERVRALMVRIDEAVKGRVIVPQKSGGNRPGY